MQQLAGGARAHVPWLGRPRTSVLAGRAGGAGGGAQDPRSRCLSLGHLAAAFPGPGPVSARSVRARAAPSVSGEQEPGCGRLR